MARHVILEVGLVLALGASMVTGPEPVAALTTAHMLQIRAEADWIVQAQRSDGAIANYVDKQAVWPYLSSFAAIGLARATAVTGDKTYATRAWKWLSWYA